MSNLSSGSAVLECPIQFASGSEWRVSSIQDFLEWFFLPPVVPVLFLVGLTTFLYFLIKSASLFRLLNIMAVTLFLSFFLAGFQRGISRNFGWEREELYFDEHNAILWAGNFLILSAFIFFVPWIIAIIAHFLVRKRNYLKRLEEELRVRQNSHE